MAHELLDPYFLSDDPQAVLDAARELARVSRGEVKKPELCNSRTLKPERDGLLCAKLFGPVEDHRCLCGFLASPDRDGEICEKCGVLCGSKALRDERWATITVPWPLVHPVLAPRIAATLGCSQKDLKLVAGFDANLNADGSITKAKKGEFSDEEAARTERGPDFLKTRVAELLLSTVPVTPANWRGGQRDAQDNAYMRLVARRNRLVRLLELDAPAIILENDYRATQKQFDRVCSVVRAELRARRSTTSVPRDGRNAELLQEVHDAPHDDGVRGIYADWLIEQGDPRGEFISLQLANAHKPMGKRESELLARHYSEWLAPISKAVDYVVFRRGFLATCRAQKEALPFLGDPIWSTVEHINTELPEFVRQPQLRALKKLTTNARCLVRLCKEAPLPITSAVVRISRCPPTGWDAVDTKSLPALRELVLLHQSSNGTSDWSWFLGSPLARQLTSLTLGMAIEHVDNVARWLPVLEAHPKLEHLALSYGKKRLVFDLRRSPDGFVVDLTTTPSLVEQACLMQEDTITPSISRALMRIPNVQVRADGNKWFGPFDDLEKVLRRRFRGNISLPA